MAPMTKSATGRVFTLYVGTDRAGARDTVVRLVAERFPSFTVIPGEGYFRGVAEPMWFIKIATFDAVSVAETAERIRIELKQDGVGVEVDNHYYRCTEDMSAKALLPLISGNGRDT